MQEILIGAEEEKSVSHSDKIQFVLSELSDRGFSIGSNGFIDASLLTEEKIQVLHDEHEQRLQKSGAEMPIEKHFYTSTLLAASLWPQRDKDGRIEYLFGKGIGIELALQGNVSGRQRRKPPARYRSHSDFELYAVDTLDDPYPASFKRAFGAQEIYPVEKTKGLKGLPDTLLRRSAETVYLGDIPFLVPMLELQFVDKLVSPGSDADFRPEGVSDAELLAQTYDLNAFEIRYALDNYVVAPAVADIEKRYQNMQATYLTKAQNSINRFIENGGMISDEGFTGSENALDTFNFQNYAFDSAKLPQVTKEYFDKENNFVVEKYTDDLRIALSKKKEAEKEKMLMYYTKAEGFLGYSLDPIVRPRNPREYLLDLFKDAPYKMMNNVDDEVDLLHTRKAELQQALEDISIIRDGIREAIIIAAAAENLPIGDFKLYLVGGRATPGKHIKWSSDLDFVIAFEHQYINTVMPKRTGESDSRDLIQKKMRIRKSVNEKLEDIEETYGFELEIKGWGQQSIKDVESGRLDAVLLDI